MWGVVTNKGQQKGVGVRVSNGKKRKRGAIVTIGGGKKKNLEAPRLTKKGLGRPFEKRATEHASGCGGAHKKKKKLSFD